MNDKENPILIKTFNFEGKEQVVSFIETMYVTDGVNCDVYAFPEDLTKDLGIIKINPGNKTPLQKVLKGERTIEGYLSGKGKLTITETDGQAKIYIVNPELKEPLAITVKKGQLMQWEANKDSHLVVYEICFPPYKDGRYKNITRV